MKKYFLPSVIWVQITVLIVTLLLVVGVYWLDSFLWGVLRVEPFTAVTKVVNPPFFSFLDECIGHRFHYSIIAAFLTGVLLIGISMLIGAAVAGICQLLRRKPLPLAPWMKDILLFEGVFLGVLAIGALFWMLFTCPTGPLRALSQQKRASALGYEPLRSLWHCLILRTGGEYLSLFQGRT